MQRELLTSFSSHSRVNPFFPRFFALFTCLSEMSVFRLLGLPKSPPNFDSGFSTQRSRKKSKKR